MKLLITGALSGLVYKYAKALAKRGHIVYAGVETKKQLETLEEKIKEEKVILFPVVINLLAEETFTDLNRLELDVIILQAGIGEGGSIYEIDMDRFRKNYEVNIFGNLKLIQAFLKYITTSNKKGKIIITSSLAAFLPIPYLSSYTSTKISLYMLAKTLRLELKYQDIPVTVSLIMPGAYQTGFNNVFIDNKTKDSIILPTKADQMTKYQKICFSLGESKNFNRLINQVVKMVEQEHPRFIISTPTSQKVLTKLYAIISLFIEL